MDFTKLIGQTIGEYTIRRELGRGGMGAVFEAEHAILQRQYAVKLLLPHVSDKEDYRQRFFREARKAAAINHPNVVNVVNAGQVEDAVYLVMEYVEGESVASLLNREKRLDPPEVVSICRQALAGIAAAHHEGIIHRDIKPDNLMVMASGVVKVADFGLARGIHDDSTKITMSGQVLGTPAYMAPEQWDGENIDARCDLYAMGVSAYEMLSGRIPFAGSSPLVIAKKVALETPPPLAELRPETDATLVAWVEQLMAKNADTRFPTADAALDALESQVTVEAIGPGGKVAPRIARSGVHGTSSGAVAGMVVGTSQATPTPGRGGTETAGRTSPVGDTLLELSADEPAVHAEPAAPSPAASVPTKPPAAGSRPPVAAAAAATPARAPAARAGNSGVLAAVLIGLMVAMVAIGFLIAQQINKRGSSESNNGPVNGGNPVANGANPGGGSNLDRPLADLTEEEVELLRRWDRFRAYASNEEWADAWGLMAEPGQREAIATMLVRATFVIMQQSVGGARPDGEEQLRDLFREILGDKGQRLKPGVAGFDELMAAAGHPDSSIRARRFLAMTDWATAHQHPVLPPLQPTGDLRDVSINGDVAHGTIHNPVDGLNRDVTFVREDGEWRLASWPDHATSQGRQQWTWYEIHDAWVSARRLAAWRDFDELFEELSSRSLQARATAAFIVRGLAAGFENPKGGQQLVDDMLDVLRSSRISLEELAGAADLAAIDRLVSGDGDDETQALCLRLLEVVEEAEPLVGMIALLQPEGRPGMLRVDGDVASGPLLANDSMEAVGTVSFQRVAVEKEMRWKLGMYSDPTFDLAAGKLPMVRRELERIIKLRGGSDTPETPGPIRDSRFIGEWRVDAAATMAASPDVPADLAEMLQGVRMTVSANHIVMEGADDGGGFVIQSATAARVDGLICRGYIAEDPAEAVEFTLTMLPNRRMKFRITSPADAMPFSLVLARPER